MKLAIIGVGNVGKSLATAAAHAGHEVILAADHRDHAEEVARGIGARAAPTPRDAAQEAEVVVLAVPWRAAKDVVRELGPAIDGKVLVDVTNPLDETFTDLATTTSAAEEIAAAAPRARVVKAFNTIFASRHLHPTEGGQPLDAFYAGDVAEAKARVAELAGSLGYRPIDVGELKMARSLEQLAFLNIRLNASRHWPWQSGWKLVGPTA